MSNHHAYNNIQEVVLDVKVVLQIIKHSQDDSRSYDALDGFLTGFSTDNITEVTNSFRNLHTSDIADDEYTRVTRNYQTSMLKRLREENQDHVMVGFYRNVSNFNFMVKPDDIQYLMQFQRQNDSHCNGTVMLVYDENRMSNGDFGLRAYRVSEKAMKMMNAVEADKAGKKTFSVSTVQNFGMTYNDILLELPVFVKSSYLMNCLLHKIEHDRQDQIYASAAGTLTNDVTRNKFHDELISPAYNIASITNLEEQTEMLKNSIEEVYNDTNRFITNQRSVQNATNKKFQIVQSKERENEEKVANGQEPAEIDHAEIEKSVKMPEEYNLLPGIVHCYQANIYAESVKNLSSGNIGKLFLADTLQEK